MLCIKIVQMFFGVARAQIRSRIWARSNLNPRHRLYLQTLGASAWLKPMDLKIDSASVAAFSDTTAEYGSDDDKFTVHNSSSRHTFIIDDSDDDDEDEDDEEDEEEEEGEDDDGRRSRGFSTAFPPDEALGGGEIQLERNTSPCKGELATRLTSDRRSLTFL